MKRASAAAGADEDEDDEAGDGKRARVDAQPPSSSSSSSTALVALPSSSSSSSSSSSAASAASLPRSSSLLDAPTMLLQGHAAGVTGVAFDASGERLASCARDKCALVWSLRAGCDNTALLRGHKNAVTDVKWLAPGGGASADGGEGLRVCTASADRTAALWDAETAVRIRSYAGHSRIVNAVAAARGRGDVFASGADDGAARVWDARSKRCVAAFGEGGPPVLAVEFAGDGASLFAAGTEGVVRQWDLRRGAAGHLALSPARSAPPPVATGGSAAGAAECGLSSVTGLSLSPDGHKLLAFSMDHSLRVWDVRPFAAGSAAGGAAGAGGAGTAAAGFDDARCLALLRGARNNFEQCLIRCAWSGDGERVACGSADRFARVWDAASARLEFALPGHAGVVTAVAMSPNAAEPVLASGGTDKRVFVGELGSVEAS